MNGGREREKFGGGEERAVGRQKLISSVNSLLQRLLIKT